MAQATQIETLILKVRIDDSGSADALNKLGGQSAKAGRKLKKLLPSIKSTDSALNRLRGTVGRTGRSLKNMRFPTKNLHLVGAATEKVTWKMAKLQAIIGALALASLAKKSLLVAAGFDKVERTLTNVLGSTAAYTEEMNFLTEQSERLGINLLSTAGNYSQLAAATKDTNLEGHETREIFLGVAEASAALGLSAEDTTGMMRALNQIISKGTLQSEELKLQLGDRLPGALKLAANAMGVTRAELIKMIEAGEVMADDFIPRFAKVLREEFGNGGKSIDTTTASMNRLQNAMDQTFNDVGKEVAKFVPILIDLVKIFGQVLTSTIIPAMAALAEKFNQASNAFEGFFLNVIKILDSEVADNLDGIDFSQQEVTKSTDKASDAIDRQTASFAALQKKMQEVKDLGFTDLVADLKNEETLNLVRTQLDIGDDQFDKLEPIISNMIEAGVSFNDVIAKSTTMLAFWGEELRDTEEEAKNLLKFNKEMDKFLDKNAMKDPVNPFTQMVDDARELKEAMDFSKTLGLTGDEIEKLGPKALLLAKEFGMSDEQIKKSVDKLKELGFFKDGLVGDVQVNSFEAGTAAASEFLIKNALETEALTLDEAQVDLLEKIEENTDNENSGNIIVK